MAVPTEPAFVWDESDDDSLALTSKGETEGSLSGAPRPDRGLLATFGGLYSVWTVCWLLAIAAAPAQQASSLLDAVMYQFGEFLAIVAAPLWFGASWWLTGASPTRVRVAWLTLGLFVLAPLPLILPGLLA